MSMCANIELKSAAIVTTSHHLSGSHNGANHLMGKGSYSSRNSTLVKPYPKGQPVSNGGSNGLSPEYYSNIRRMNQFSSSTSLQNEIANSNNVSPISSPLPSNMSYRSMPLSKTPSTMSRMNSSSNLKSMKRWSASQEFRLSSLEHSK